jgi:sec-independent protein translocase protein TatA
MNEWVIVAIVAVAVIFLGSRLPQIARNVGKAQNEFKQGLKEGAAEDEAKPATPPVAPASPVVPPAATPVEPPPTTET